MKILFLGGVFAEENEAEVVRNATAPVEFSANVFQKRLIKGLKDVESEMDVQAFVLSAPFINAYPTGSKTIFFKGFEKTQKEFTYVSFNNIWGIRNFSRAKALKKAILSFVDMDDKEKLIIVYSPHTPFIKAAEYAKKKDSRIKICLYVPDLPQYMNLSENRGFIYNVAKKYDIASMTKHMSSVDSFVLLTEHMKEKLPVGNKPYFVAEGILDSSFVEAEEKDACDVCEKYVVYTGKLDKKFGIYPLIESMKYIKDENVKLVLCGKGDLYEYACSQSEKDKRILALGQLSPMEAKDWQKKSSVLVNPRCDRDEYTKYSFPSKNIEYLLSGKPTVAYMLSGIPQIYRNFFFEISPEGEPSQEIAKAVENALRKSKKEVLEKKNAFLSYANEKLCAKNIAVKIIKLNF